jgi:hypothetical protein
MYSA